MPAGEPTQELRSVSHWVAYIRFQGRSINAPLGDRQLMPFAPITAGAAFLAERRVTTNSGALSD